MIENFAVTYVTLNILCLPVKYWNWWLSAYVYSFNFIITQNLNAYQNQTYEIVAYTLFDVGLRKSLVSVKY